MDAKNNKLKENKVAQEMQDEIFRKMSAEKKIKLVSQFFEFGKVLSKLNDKKA
jgi:hypothetical protein